jgi:hypothetical protein
MVRCKVLPVVHRDRVKVVQEIKVVLFGPYQCFQISRTPLLVPIQIKPGVNGELVITQEPVLGHAFAHGAYLEIFHPHVLLPELLHGHIQVPFIICESVEIVIHQLCAHKVGHKSV